MAALEIVKHRIQPPHHKAEARKRAPDGDLTLYAHQQPTDEDRQNIAHKLYEQQLHKALRAVDAAEV